MERAGGRLFFQPLEDVHSLATVLDLAESNETGAPEGPGCRRRLVAVSILRPPSIGGGNGLDDGP